MNQQAFDPDARYREIAEAYSLDAIDFARKAFRIQLDWSDHSVEKVEQVLSDLHRDLLSQQPTDEQVMQMAKMLGSYVGEVFRRNHGAEWGMVHLGEESFPGLRTEKGGATFWPWGRAFNRLKNGPEDNIWHYYQILATDNGKGIAPKAKSWWQRVTGG
ncbi:MAG: hypothetical protein ACYC7A_06150 [Thermoanaerobaculia bacterium]